MKNKTDNRQVGFTNRTKRLVKLESQNTQLTSHSSGFLRYFSYDRTRDEHADSNVGLGTAEDFRRLSFFTIINVDVEQESICEVLFNNTLPGRISTVGPGENLGSF